MKSIFIFIALLCLNSLTLISQESFTIDHTHNKLDDIPDQWIEAAKNSLYIGYGHTSHGSQIISGMNAIKNYFTDKKYDWSHTGGEGKLHLFEGDGYGDGYLDHDIGYSGWDDETREYLDKFPECNVIVWSWCGQVNSTNLETHMFEPMELLESEYPDVQFVYMTGHLEGLGADGTVNSANEKIRDYCKKNNKILFDFADIEKYDPDALMNYQEYFASDNCDYDPDGQAPANRSENWAKNWVANNPQHELSKITSKCTSCAHSVNLNCVKKGVASWYLWARLAGWDGNSEVAEIEQIFITSKDNASSISTKNGTLQLYANALPENAILPSVIWSITEGDEFASINQNGLISAKANGTVKILVSANDIPELNASFEITIVNQKVSVASIQLSSANDITSIKSDENLQLLAQVIPENATNQSVNWSISQGADIASIDEGGLLTAKGAGQVTVVATSAENPEIEAEFNITISNQYIAISNIHITSNNGISTIDKLNGTLQLNAEISPENSTIKTVHWSIPDCDDIAGIDSTGLITAKADGSITVVAADPENPSVYGTFEIVITNQATTSIFNSNDFVFIQNRNILKINNSRKEEYIMQIIDLSGRIVLQSEMQNGLNIFNLKPFHKGCYVLHIYSGQRLVLSKKIVF